MRFAPWLIPLVAACSFEGAPVTQEPDSGPPTGQCGSPGALQTSFDPGDEGMFFSEGITNLTFNGELQLVAREGEEDFVSTDYGVKLTGHAIGVEVTSPMTGNGEARFVVGVAGDSFAFVFNGSQIRTEIDVPGQNSQSTSTPFDEGRHRHLRIREQGGTVFLETAGDLAGPFEVISQVDVVLDIPVLAAFEIEDNAAGFGGTISFDNLNTEAEPALWCPPFDFSDSFEEQNRNQNWVRFDFDDRCTGMDQIAGNARFDQDQGSGQALCANRAIAGYDLTQGPAVVEMTTISDADGDNWRAFIAAVSPDQEFVRLGFFEDQTCAETSTDIETCLPYDDNIRYFRVSMPSPATVLFETSIDGVQWTEVATRPSPFDGRLVNLRIGTQSASLNVEKQFRIESYNLL